jgi:hypothetical protein
MVKRTCQRLAFIVSVASHTHLLQAVTLLLRTMSNSVTQENNEQDGR